MHVCLYVRFIAAKCSGSCGCLIAAATAGICSADSIA